VAHLAGEQGGGAPDGAEEERGDTSNNWDTPDSAATGRGRDRGGQSRMRDRPQRVPDTIDVGYERIPDAKAETVSPRLRRTCPAIWLGRRAGMADDYPANPVQRLCSSNTRHSHLRGVSGTNPGRDSQERVRPQERISGRRRCPVRACADRVGRIRHIATAS
jgi:hypothetical protein